MRHTIFTIAMLVCMQVTASEAVVPVSKWTLLDQNDRPYTLNDDAQVMLIARSMSAAKILDAAIEDAPQGYLESRHIIYVADIEKMPSLVKLVAVPAMRSAKYRILLDREARVSSPYNGDRDTVQWLVLNKGALVKEQRFNDGAQLKKAIAELPH